VPTHRRARRSVAFAPYVRRMSIYALGLAVVVGGGLGLVRGQDEPAANPVAGVRTDERASRGQTRATVTASASATAAPSAAATPSATPAPTATPGPKKAPTKAPTGTTAPRPTSAAAGCSTYSGNQLIACNMLPSFGFATSQMPSLDKLWQHESGWRHTASNPSSGAYGIPQALPGTKMATAGSDWRTNPATQIKWGLGYIKQRYGTPNGAWAHFQWYNWY